MNAKDYMQKKKGKKRQKDVRKSPAKKGAADYLNLGVDDVERGKLEQALVNYNKAIALNPNIAEAYYNRGTLYLMQNQSNQALEDLEQAIRLNPGYAKAYCHRGTLYLGQDQFNRALADFNQAIDLNSKYSECYANRGTLYLKQNQFVLALNDLDKAVEFADSKAQKQHLCLLISLNCTMAKAFDQARKYVEKAFDGFLDWSQSQHKQTCLDNINLTEKLYRKNAELEQTNQQLQNAQHRLQRLVADYTHDVGSLIRPDIVYNVAQEIKEKLPVQSLSLYNVYHAEVSIRHRSEMLRIKHVTQDPEAFRVLIRRDRIPDNLTTATTLQDLFKDTLQKMVWDFLYYDKLDSRRERLLRERHWSLSNLRQHFTQQVIFENKNIQTWVNEQLFAFHITECSPLWEKVKLKKYGSTENLLYGYFVELLFNVFKYSDYRELTLRFSQQERKGRTYLLSTWENSYQDNQSISTGNGLNAIRNELQLLNESLDPATTLQQWDDPTQRTFCVTLAFKKDVLIYETEKRKHAFPT